MLVGLIIIVAGVAFLAGGRHEQNRVTARAAKSAKGSRRSKGRSRGSGVIRKTAGKAAVKAGLGAGRAAVRGGKWAAGKAHGRWTTMAHHWREPKRICAECKTPVRESQWGDHWLVAHDRDAPTTARPEPAAAGTNRTARPAPVDTAPLAPPRQRAAPTAETARPGAAPTAGTAPAGPNTGGTTMEHLLKIANELATAMRDVPIQRVSDYDNLMEIQARMAKMFADSTSEKRAILVEHAGYDPRAVEGMREVTDAYHELGTSAHNAQRILRNLPAYKAILDAEAGDVRLPHHGRAA